MQIVQPAHQPLEVADAVAVGVHVGGDRQAINDRILVPEVLDHAISPNRARSFRRATQINRADAARFLESTTTQPDEADLGRDARRRPPVAGAIATARRWRAARLRPARRVLPT